MVIQWGLAVQAKAAGADKAHPSARVYATLLRCTDKMYTVYLVGCLHGVLKALPEAAALLIELCVELNP